MLQIGCYSMHLLLQNNAAESKFHCDEAEPPLSSPVLGINDYSAYFCQEII